MLILPPSVRIFLAAEAVDMRNGIDGLCSLVRRWGGDPFDGHLYVFLSSRRDRVKILTWTRGGRELKKDVSASFSASLLSEACGDGQLLLLRCDVGLHHDRLADPFFEECRHVGVGDQRCDPLQRVLAGIGPPEQAEESGTWDAGIEVLEVGDEDVSEPAVGLVKQPVA